MRDGAQELIEEMGMFFNASGLPRAAGRIFGFLMTCRPPEVGLADWRVVRLHAASLGEREIEYYPGLERRGPDEGDWSVMHRSIRPVDADALDEATRAQLAASLGPGDCIVSTPGRMTEFRFWVAAADAVAAAAEADARVQQALMAIGRRHWKAVRVQTASVAERRREVYRGVERRLAGARET